MGREWPIVELGSIEELFVDATDSASPVVEHMGQYYLITDGVTYSSESPSAEQVSTDFVATNRIEITADVGEVEEQGGGPVLRA